MRRVSIWASGLLASAIPFAFVGAVIVFGACIFEAVGLHAPPAHPSSPFHMLTVASANAPNNVARHQSSKHAQSDRRHRHAGPPPQSRSHSRVRPSPFEFGWPFADHFAKPNYPARPFANLQ